MQISEANHLNAVEELQVIYEKKLAIQGNNFLSLEQQKLERKNEYMNKIAQLRKQNEDSINKLMADFKVNLSKVQHEYGQSMKTTDQNKEIYEKKIDVIDVAHEDKIQSMKEEKELSKENLMKQWEEFEV